jgi:hypothetical protein
MYRDENFFRISVLAPCAAIPLGWFHCATRALQNRQRVRRMEPGARNDTGPLRQEFTKPSPYWAARSPDFRFFLTVGLLASAAAVNGKDRKTAAAIETVANLKVFLFADMVVLSRTILDVCRYKTHGIGQWDCSRVFHPCGYGVHE